MNRQDAWALLTEFSKNPSLVKHGLAVEAAMRAYARRFGEDEQLWGMVGLIHDFDYERFPDMGADTPEDQRHTIAGTRILEERYWPEEIVEAVRSHADYAGVPRDTLLKQTLFAVDELTGLIIAVALVRPSKSLHHVKVKSVRKKWKDKAFAAGVIRTDIELGARELGVDLWVHVQNVIDAMRSVASELGLDGAE